MHGQRNIKIGKCRFRVVAKRRYKTPPLSLFLIKASQVSPVHTAWAFEEIDVCEIFAFLGRNETYIAG